MTRVLICAAGDGSRWHGGEPKQLAWLGDETILQRQIRQVKQRGAEPWVLTHDELIARRAVRYGAVVFEPQARRYLVETMLSSQALWAGHTVLLLGDVVCSRALMDALLADTRPVSVYGNNAEALALSFTDAGTLDVLQALHRVLTAAEQRRGPGKLWNLYRVLDGLPIGQHFILDDGVFVRVHDWSSDIDTPAFYTWFQRHVLERQIMDDRLEVEA